MVKALRSLVLEKLPFELRVKIELLSRRRDIVNKEKQDELLKLLREFKIDNVVPLGPGTNRYAFKLDGFVIKVATDNDGKIDNFKEFKMAKRLYPYVTKTYDVSENGTLLVAEYIQPFSSYGEMLGYADKIREILTKLSSVYLIGDVGITAKNFSNWGVRVGEDEPVCLDFAYVYDVSSELFICRHCKSGSMLVPNKDFTELVCPNKGCGAKYQFEDIRAKLGNDIHRHEIGDLTEEGYLLSESNVLTELTNERSNYLVRKIKKKSVVTKQPEDENVSIDNFVMEHEPSYYVGTNNNSNIIKEEQEMTDMNVLKQAAEDVVSRAPEGAIILKATKSRVVNHGKVTEPKKTMQANVEPDHEEESDLGVAFSVDMTKPEEPQKEHEVVTAPAEEVKVEAEIITPPPVVQEEVKETAEVQQVKQEEVSEPAPVVVTAKSSVTVKEGTNKPANKPVQQKRNNNGLSDNFKNRVHQALSSISNKVGTELHIRGIYDDVKGNLKNKKMFPEAFYKTIQSSVFAGLADLCNFTEATVPNNNGKGYHKEFTAPEQLEGTSYTPTLIFVGRIWDNRYLNEIENPAEMLDLYREKFNNYLGFQKEFEAFFRDRLKRKLQIDSSGYERVAKAVLDVWMEPVKDEDPEPEKTDGDKEVTGDHEPTSFVEEAVQTETAEYHQEETTEVTAETESESGAPAEDEFVDSSEEVESGNNVLPDISGSYSMESGQEVESSDTYEDDGEDQPLQPELLTVEIFPEDDIDVIRLKTDDAFGSISIPFFTKLDEIDINEKVVPSLADDRNGIWDWLIHMVPDLMFNTEDPEKWLEINTYPIAEDQAHIVILDENDGVYTMGIYFLLGIYTVDDENNYIPVTDEETVAKLNKLFKEDIGYSRLSHYKRSLTMTDLIRSEEYIEEALVHEEESYDEEMEESDEMNDMTEQATAEDLENAAIAALNGTAKVEMADADQEEEEYQEETEAVEASAETEVETEEEDPDKKLMDTLSPASQRIVEEEEKRDKTYTPIRRHKKETE